MTCTHFLDLIDAGPLVDTLPEVLEALEAHAARCAVCAYAGAVSTELAAGLTALPTIDAPVKIAAAVEARIAAIAEPLPVQRPDRTAGPDWRAWFTLGGSAVAMLALLPSYAMTPELIEFIRTSEPAFPLEARAISMGALLVSVTVFLILLFRPVAADRGSAPERV